MTRRRGHAHLGALLALLAACSGSLESDSPRRRADAVRALASRRGDAAVPVLLVAQRDPSPLVRQATAEVVAARGGPHAAEALGAMLADPDPGVATAAASGLARLGDLEGSRAALVEGYARASPAGRLAIAGALDQIGVSLRDAVEAEARIRWTRNLSVLATGSPEARAGAIEELGASGRSEAVARIRALLEGAGPDRRIAIAALRALGESGDWAVRPLLERELGRPDAEHAEAAALALGRLGDPAATPVLARLAALGSSAVSQAALLALKELPAAPEVSSALCGVAQRSPAPSIAGVAARAAWARNADCRASAFAARAARGDPAAQAAIAELHPEQSVLGPLAARLAASVSDPRAGSDRRRRAATLLGQLSWSAGAPAIEARARLVRDRLRSARAGWVTGSFTGEGSLPAEPAARLAFLRDRPASLPPRAPELPPRVAEWIDLTSDEDREELGTLLAAAGRLQSPEARALLGEGARDPSSEVRAGAVDGLGHLGGNEPDAALVDALRDPVPEVRLAAVRALARYGPSAVPPLADAVARSAEEDPAWREALADALGRTGAPDALPHLVTLLAGPAAGEAAQGLAALGLAEAAAPLLAHLSRRDSPGRVEVLDALAQLASPSAGKGIERELLSERPDVRMAAARAIGRLRHEPSSGWLEALRVDYDGRVRRAAIEALAKLPSGRPRGP